MSERPILRVEGVTKRFAGLVALNKVSMELKREKITGLIGPNGSGKTTLFNVITGFYKPEEGRVYFEEREITGLPPHKVVALGIARTFQVVKPFGGLTVEEAVRIGAYKAASNEDEVKEIVDWTLSLVGLDEVRRKKCAECNLVQMKLTEVARSLATKPKLLLLDEPASGLNPVEIDKFTDFLKRIKREQEMTLCVVEHVMRFVMGLSDHIVVLHAGEKIAEGTPREVSSNELVVKAYLGEGAE